MGVSLSTTRADLVRAVTCAAPGMAQAKYVADNLAAAQADLDRAVALAPNLPEAYGHRAGLYEKRGELQKAVDDLTRMIELAPEQPMPYYERAVVYLAMDQREKGIADLRQVLKLEKSDDATAFAVRKQLETLGVQP